MSSPASKLQVQLATLSATAGVASKRSMVMSLKRILAEAEEELEKENRAKRAKASVAAAVAAAAAASSESESEEEDDVSSWRRDQAMRRADAAANVANAARYNAQRGGGPMINKW